MIADSSFLVAFFHPDDLSHSKAVDQFSSMSGTTVIIPDRILEETFTVLTYNKGLEFALEVLKRIHFNSELAIYPVTQHETNEIFILAETIKKKISFADYCVVYLCNKLDMKPLCFDKQILSLLKR